MSTTHWEDSAGRVWATAEEALAEFLSDLPDMTEEESESVFQFTLSGDTPADYNLRAIDSGILYGGYYDLFKHYPVPYKVVTNH